MVARAGKKNVKGLELEKKLLWFVNYKEKTVTLSSMFLEMAKDMSSPEFKKYMEILRDNKGFEMIIVNN